MTDELKITVFGTSAKYLDHLAVSEICSIFSGKSAFVTREVVGAQSSDEEEAFVLAEDTPYFSLFSLTIAHISLTPETLQTSRAPRPIDPEAHLLDRVTFSSPAFRLCL